MFFGCSKTSDKEYMKMADDNLEKGNISEAISGYDKLISEHPESEIVIESKLKRDALYSYLKLKKKYPSIDSLPEIIIDQAAVLHTDKKSLSKAADLFFLIALKYPHYEKAPSSLFMAAFIYANEIQDLEKAKETYNLFIKKYPNDELTSSAKEELEYMGLSPEEILKKKIAAQDKE
jgi:TolA-binding protein